MKTILASCAALALVMSPGHAQEFISGAQLAKACMGSAPADRAACDGFLAGAMDQAFVTPELKGRLCLPAGTKLGALREGLDKFVRNRPDGSKGTAVALVDEMVKVTFPCPGK